MSSEPGADEAADAASTLLVADPVTTLLVALGFPSKPLIVLLDHAEHGVGRCRDRCVGRYGGVSMSTRPSRGSTENEPGETERAKNEERTRKEKPVRSERYPVFAVSFDGIERVGGNRLAVSRVGGTFRRYLELAAFFWRKR